MIENSQVLNARYLDDEFLFKIGFRGLVEFDDKYILPTISSVQNNLHFSDIMKVLSEHKIDVNVEHGVDNFSI